MITSAAVRGRWARIGATAASAIVVVSALAATPANAAPPPEESGFTTAAIDCDAVMADTDPRAFNVYTADSGTPGGVTYGQIWVDRRSDGTYNVCIGRRTEQGFVNQAVVADLEQDHPHGVRPYVTYVNSAGTRGRYLLPFMVFNTSVGYNWRGYGISGLYAGICVVDNDPLGAVFESSCDDER